MRGSIRVPRARRKQPSNPSTLMLQGTLPPPWGADLSRPLLLMKYWEAAVIVLVSSFWGSVKPFG